MLRRAMAPSLSLVAHPETAVVLFEPFCYSESTALDIMDTGSINIVVVSAVMSILACLAVALRFWSRRLKRASYGADDYLIWAL